MKITFDPDIPADIQPQIEELIKDSVEGKCSCGSNEIYVSIIDNKLIDVKCYDCGSSFFEAEIDIEEE